MQHRLRMLLQYTSPTLKVTRKTVEALDESVTFAAVGTRRWFVILSKRIVDMQFVQIFFTIW